MGHMASGSSAHPLLVPGTDTYIDFLMVAPMMPFSKDYYIDLYTFEASAKGLQARKRVASVPVDAGFYMHSFGLTQNHVVLPLNMVMGGVGPTHKAVLLGKFEEQWEGVHVVSLAGGNVQVFNDMVPFEHVHTANTFEN